jgi:DUF1680 family protein
LVYCTEWADNKESGTLDLFMYRDNKYTTAWVPELLNGVTVIRTKGNSTKQTATQGKTKDRSITAIPYYSWANRGSGEMNVWMNVQK